MKDKETGLTFRTLKAVELFIAETIVNNNAKYTFAQALRDVPYSARYIQSNGAKIWSDMRVQGLISKAKAALTVKTSIKTGLTVEKVLADLDKVEHSITGEDGKVFRGQVHNYLKIAELRGKYLAMWTENVTTTDLTRQKELDKKQRAEAAELARLRLGEKYGIGSDGKGHLQIMKQETAG